VSALGLRWGLVLDRLGRDAERSRRGDPCRDDLSSVFSRIPHSGLVNALPARNRDPAFLLPGRLISNALLLRNINIGHGTKYEPAEHRRRSRVAEFSTCSLQLRCQHRSIAAGGTTIALLLSQQKTNAR